jgi:Tfp pilus assembly protein PilO
MVLNERSYNIYLEGIMEKIKKITDLRISKKKLIMGIVIAVFIIGLVVFFYLKGGSDLKLGSEENEEVDSGSEASEKLTDVASDISSFREDLDGLTRGFGGSNEE